ncbi:MAG: hypothetical protein HYY76_16000 [Acidobacteria bacterium]|nr:hypothetical protein [Acidobacteriota bacterium]
MALEAMQALDAPADDKAKIFEYNARRVFRLHEFVGRTLSGPPGRA